MISENFIAKLDVLKSITADETQNLTDDDWGELVDIDIKLKKGEKLTVKEIELIDQNYNRLYL